MKRKDAQLIADIKEYLDDNLYQAHPIAELCRRFSVNREKLQAGFHELTQSTVHAYIIHQRIEHAALRLLETEDSIKVIAMDSGYKKQRSFNKTFKTIYQLTPATYRKLHQQPEL
jgi:AraC-like DNA-binding protein